MLFRQSWGQGNDGGSRGVTVVVVVQE